MERPFPADPILTGIAIAFRNPALIADEVMPRTTVGAETFKWHEFDFAEGITQPITIVGRKGRPTEVEFTAEERTGSVEDHALDLVMPNDDVVAARRQGIDIMGRSTELLQGLIDNGREVRVAAMVADEDNYNHVDALSTADQFDNPDADPSTLILDIISTPLVRPNVAVTSLAVMNKLRKNVALVSAITGNTSGKGIVTAQQVADYFELDRILVGQGYVNVAKPGQTPQYARVWGNTFALHRQAQTVVAENGEPSWGFTAQWQDRVVKQIPEPKTGLRGAVRLRNGESVGEYVQSKEAGYLLTNVLGGP